MEVNTISTLATCFVTEKFVLILTIDRKQQDWIFSNSLENINFTELLDDESSAISNSECPFISPCGKLSKEKTLSKYIRSRGEFVAPIEIKPGVDFENYNIWILKTLHVLLKTDDNLGVVLGHK